MEIWTTQKNQKENSENATTERKPSSKMDKGLEQTFVQRRYKNIQ